MPDTPPDPAREAAEEYERAYRGALLLDSTHRDMHAAIIRPYILAAVERAREEAHKELRQCVRDKNVTIDRLSLENQRYHHVKGLLSDALRATPNPGEAGKASE